MGEALVWLNGYIHGLEHAVGAVEAYAADGQELGKALLMAQVACLNFIADVANNVTTREMVVQCFRTGDAKNTAVEVSK